MNDTQNYSKREIDEHFSSLKSLLHEQDLARDKRFGFQDKVLVDIQNEVKRTNGRVSSLEKWRWVLTGGSIVIMFLIGTIIIPVMLKFL